MAMTSPWPLIHAERDALIADLGTITDQQWATPSLCADWTVRDALGHMISTAKMTPPKFFTSMAAAGFRFTNMNAALAELAGAGVDTLKSRSQA